MVKLCFIITDWHFRIALNLKHNNLLFYPNLPSGPTLVLDKVKIKTVKPQQAFCFFCIKPKLMSGEVWVVMKEFFSIGGSAHLLKQSCRQCVFLQPLQKDCSQKLLLLVRNQFLFALNFRQRRIRYGLP